MGQQETWNLWFNTAHLPGKLLTHKVYENLTRAEYYTGDQARDRAAMYISRTGTDCASITGRFQVLDYEIDYSVPDPRPARAIFYFEQHCNEDTSTVLTGCVHYQQ